jgi:hypothetical protein
MLKYWKWAVFVLSVLTASLVLFDFGMSLGTTCPFHQPISAIETASQSTPKHCSIEKSASYGAIRSFVEFIEHGEHFFVAFGTIVIAIFTVVLAFATAFLMIATNRLWKAGERQIAIATVAADHIPRVERAYLTGGGKVVPMVNKNFLGKRHFVVEVANYGKTPAYLIGFGVCFATMEEVQEVKTEAMHVFPWYPYDDRIRPDGVTKELKRIPLPHPEPEVVYGAFWYLDLLKKERVFRFILRIEKNGDTHTDVTGVHKGYTHWD